MIQRFMRIGVSFAVVITAYWVYALVAVPLIEPSAEEMRPTIPVGEGETIVRPIDRNRMLIERNFPAGAWERGEGVMVIETNQAMLLIKEYKNEKDGRMRLSPCSMIFMTKQTQDGRLVERPIILQAPQGAILKFGETFDLKRAEFGKLDGGQLVGPVLISSRPTRAGADDALRIETRDVQLAQDRIWTPHPVTFQFGPNQGSGRLMQIALAGKEDSDASGKRRSGIGALKSFELTHDVKMRVHVGGSGLTGASRPASGQNETTANSQPPVEVTCKGPFRFELDGMVATFSDQVDVLRFNAGGPADQMLCERLAIYFARGQETAKTATAPAPSAGPPSGLHASLIVAEGNPVIVTLAPERAESPESGGYVRCQRLEFDVRTERIMLEGSKEIQLHQGTNEIRTRRLDYQPSPTGRLGRLLASGPGWLQGAMPADPSKKYQASWSRELRLRPHEQNQVLSLQGSAQMRFSELGALAAEEIHVWLLESSAPAVPPATFVQPVGFVRNQRRRVDPDRMMARGNVNIHSPQLTGATGRLEVWFKRVADTLGQPSPGDAVGTQADPLRAARRPTNQQFDVGGALVQVQFSVQEGKNQLSEVTIDGNARLSETKTARPGDKPLLLKGERLHVAQADTPQSRADVAGNPAYVEARGLTLTGGRIELDRAANRLWINGPGRMTLPVDRDMDGKKLPSPRSLEVVWQQGMDFNGKRVLFERSVVARGDHELLRTEQLEVLLKRPIDFANTSSQRGAEGQTELEKIICRGGSFLERRTFNERGQASVEQILTRDLTVDRITGAIDATGPGNVTSVRRGAAVNMMARPGTVPPPVPASDAKADQLNDLNVRFERAITGNLYRRELTFGDQVKAVHGPVAEWEQKLDADEPDRLGPDGVVLTCDQLVVRQMPDPNPKMPGWAEMEAIGHTVVEGSIPNRRPGPSAPAAAPGKFTARAHRLTYNQQKGQVMLEGDGRSDAQLFQQSRPGESPSTTAAGRIWFSPATNAVSVENFKYSDVGLPPAKGPPARGAGPGF